jgi:glycosyltransferase involved in cell wall biosynthesis
MRPDAVNLPGGDVVQLLKTRQYLEKFGIDVDVSSEISPNLRGYDIAHLFLLDIHFYENYARYKNATRQRKPVVLSPIYWNPAIYTASGHAQFLSVKEKMYYLLPNGIMRDVLSMISWVKPSKELAYLYAKNMISMNFSKRKHQVELLKSCGLVLPNSKIELRLIMKDFGLDDESRFLVVPNAADGDFQHAKSDRFESRFDARDFVLCAGRMEPRKNQLLLIRALRGTGLKLVLIGGPRKTSLGYYQKCRREADRNVLFMNWMGREDLASAYAAAKVHALPSWVETPGLVSLEAGLAGCNVVTTRVGSATEYFGEYAWYCDPSSVQSIRTAVEDAFAAKRSEKLREHILTHFTWEKAAEKTLQAYKMVLESS